MPLKGGRTRCHQLLHSQAELLKQLRSGPVERLTHNVVERFTRLDAYYSQTTASKVNRRRLARKTASNHNSIGLDLRSIVLSLVFHKALELPMRRMEGAKHRIATLHDRDEEGHPSKG
jgi:hypothetical protein